MGLSWMDNNNAIEQWAQSVLSSLSAPERKKIFRQIALELRKRNQKSITAQQDPDGNAWTPRKPEKKQGSVGRKKKMMLGLRKVRRLKTQSSPAGLSIGYEAKDAKIARVHHYGLRDKPSPKARMITYSARPLLGISSTDKRFLREHLLRQLIG